MAENTQNPQKDLELLTCSAGDYVASQGRNLNAYELVEILTSYRPSKFEDNSLGYARVLAKQKGCEVVVDIRFMNPPNMFYHMGTGLKLKDNLP